MKIEFKKKENSEEGFKYYNEFYGILLSYRKLLVNPCRKVFPILRQYINNTILSLISFAVILFFYCTNNKLLYLVFSILFFIIFLSSLYLYFRYRIVIKKQVDDHRKSYIDVDEEKIIFSTKSSTYSYKQNIYWENVKYILFNKYSIFFLPTKKSNPSFSCSIDYKDEILELLKKFNKIDLLVDNTKLYRG